MMQRVGHWYAGLTGRERVLVTLAGAILALIILIYGIILPLGRAHDAAEERHRLALDNAGRVQAGLAALKTGDAVKAASGGGSLHLMIASEADALGFDLPSNQPRGNDMTAITIPAARPQVLLRWIADLEARGIILELMTLRPAPDGSVAANAVLRRAGS